MINKIINFSLFGILLLLGAVSLSPKTALAKTTLNNDLTPISCSDYSKNENILINTKTAFIGNTVPGTKASFETTIQNDNNFPIINGSLYVKIFRKSNQGSNLNVLNAVDEFIVESEINLGQNDSRGIIFDWNVPTYALSGDYEMATYFTVQNRFNIKNDISEENNLGNTTAFKVSGGQNLGVYLNKNNTKLDNKIYDFTSPAPTVIGVDSTIKTEFELKNTTSKAQSIAVKYSLYNESPLIKENLINSKTEVIQIPANSVKKISYSADDIRRSKYYLAVEANYKDTRSIINLSFLREGVNKAKIVNSGINNYPLVFGRKNTAFVCINNSGIAEYVSNNEVVITITDTSGTVLHESKYKGKITKEIMGLGTEWMPVMNIGDFIVRTDLYTNDRIVDSIRMEYSCDKLGERACDISNIVLQNANLNASGNYVTWIIFTSILILLITLLFIIRLKKHKKIKKVYTRLIALFIIFIVLTSILQVINEYNSKVNYQIFLEEQKEDAINQVRASISRDAMNVVINTDQRIATNTMLNKRPTVPVLNISKYSVCDNESISAVAQSTDFEGQDIYYEFNIDGANVRVPQIGYLKSGYPAILSKAFSAGSHTVKARTFDINNASSSYSSILKVNSKECPAGKI